MSLPERNCPTTALTLLMRDGRPVYQAIGGMGADSLLIDAETGGVIKTPPSRVLTRYFRQAHFYFCRLVAGDRAGGIFGASPASRHSRVCI